MNTITITFFFCLSRPGKNFSLSRAPPAPSFAFPPLSAQENELSGELADRAVRERERAHHRLAAREEPEESRQRLENEPRDVSADQLLALDHLAHLVVRLVTEPLEASDAVEEPIRVSQ